jgi:CHAT domain-containing protein/lipopolysaccharide biosynthesis regulator YciM
MARYYAAAFFIPLAIFFFNLHSNAAEKSPDKSIASGIDSVRTAVEKSGWNSNLCFEYQKYIINSKIKFDAEEEILDKLPSGTCKSFIHSLILKKRMKFKEMYYTLFSLLKEKPCFYSFYNELAFSAAASNQLSNLESKIDKIFTSSDANVFKDYLFALINQHKGKYKNAISYFEKVYKTDPGSADVILQYSAAFRNSGNYEKAHRVLIRGKETLKKDEWLLASSLMAEGSLYFLSAEYKLAEELYNKAYKISRRKNLEEPEGKILVNLGIMDDLKGDIGSARKKFNQAAAIASRINDFEGEASAYSELGVSFSFTNDLIESKKNYQKSYEIYKPLGNKVRLSLLSQNLGKIYLNLFSYQKALEYFQEGLKYAGENKRAQVLNLTGLADCYTNLSNYSKALSYYKEAHEIASEIKELALSAEIDYGLGILNHSLDRFSSALKYFRSAKKEADQAEDPFLTADIYHKIGISYFELDSLEKSEEYLNEALSLSKKYGIPYTEAQCLIDLAIISFTKNEFDKSGEFLIKAKGIAGRNQFRHLLANAVLNEGKIAEAKNLFNAARKKFKECLRIAQQLPEYDLIVESNYRLAKLFEKNNLEEAAESYYKSALISIDEVSVPLFNEGRIQISYFAAKREIYEKYAEFLLNRERYREAFELIDNSRSRNTMRNLKNIKLETLVNNKNLLDEFYDTEWAVSSRFYDKILLDSVQAKYKMMKEDLIKQHPRMEKYLQLTKKYSIDEIQRELSTGENIVSIYSDDNSTFLFLLTKDKFFPFHVDIGKDRVTGLVSGISPYFEYGFSESRSYYNQDLFAFNVEAAFNLYSEILKPLVDKIPDDEKIIFSPSTELISVPLEFLVTKYDAKESLYEYSAKDYLIYKNDISYIPSCGMYIEQKNNKLRNNEKVLIAGNPSINRRLKGFDELRGILDDLNGTPRNFMLMPLKYSGDEINQISSIIKADKVLSASNATESNFKSNAEMNKLIHLSTHSFLFEKQPLILFSNSYDPVNDGFLEAGEIVKMKLNSDLVVLSSCNSGLGEIDPSEGILGMTKAFFEAGAKSVVVSLWDVNDKYTSKFMGLFYKRLAEGYDKSKALRMAKIDFINEYSPNPYFWGAFVLSGNISKISLSSPSNMFPYFIGLLVVIVISILIINIKKKH